MNKENSSPIEKLFGSKTRTKLLALFFENSSESYYVREITRVIDEQINSVRRELINLEGLGIIKSESYDGKIYYSANEKHPFCRPLIDMFTYREGGTKEVKVVQKNIWEEQIQPVKKYLRALLVTNRAPMEEGMDMLIIGDNSEKKLTSWASKIEKKKGKPLNFMILSENDFMYRKSVRDKTVTEILDMAVTAVVDPHKILR